MILHSIYRYPVKGFSPEALDSIDLQEACVLPFDRHWSLAFGGSESIIDSSESSSWVGKRNLLSLSRAPRAAQLQTEFDDKLHRLIIKQGGVIKAQGDLHSAEGRQTIENFLNKFYADTAFGDFHILHAASNSDSGGGFTDFAHSHLSFININTVKDIAKTVGQELNPLRFRSNFLFEAPAWEERNWVGKNLKINDCEFTCIEEIERCRATSVCLESGEETLNLPLSLQKNYHHRYCGIYVQNTKGGIINTGSNIEVK